MSASKQDIKRWLKEGKDIGATHVIIALDTFDHENYPIYVMPGKSVRDEVAFIKVGPSQSVDEVYDLSMSIAGQLDVIKAYNV
jgi:hypothetical protein